MFTKNKITYSEAFKYLRHKERNVVALKIQGINADDYIEVDMDNPLKVSVDKNSGVVKFGTWFVAFPDDLSYGSIKKAIIQLRYSNDDQMALILNKDDSEEDSILYQKMQEWREFASTVARKVTSDLGE